MSSLGVSVKKVKLVGLVPNSKLCPRWEREFDNQAPVSKDAAECLRDFCFSIFGQLLYVPQSNSILWMPTMRPRVVPMSGWAALHFPRDCGHRQEVAQSRGFSDHGKSVDRRVGRRICLNPC